MGLAGAESSAASGQWRRGRLKERGLWASCWVGAGGGPAVGFSELGPLRLFRSRLPIVTDKGSRAGRVRPRKSQWAERCKLELLFLLIHS